MSTVGSIRQLYRGSDITNTFANFNNAPDPSFEIEALYGYYGLFNLQTPHISISQHLYQMLFQR